MGAPFVISMKIVGDASSAVSAAEQTVTSIDKVQQEAARVSATGAQASIDRIFGLDGSSAALAQTEEDVESFGAELNALRAKFNPLFAAEQQHVAALAEIDAASKLGAIDAEETAAAIAAETASYEASVAAISGSTVALEAQAVAHEELSGQAQAAEHAARGFFEQLALGVSPTQAITAHLGELSYAASGEGGLVGSFKGLGTVFSSLLTGPNLIAVGVIGVTVAAASLWSTLSGGGEQAAEAALKRQKDFVDQLAAAYPTAAKAAKDYQDQAAKLSPAQAQDTAKTNAADLQRQLDSARASVDSFLRDTEDLADFPNQSDAFHVADVALGDLTGDTRKAIQAFVDGKSSARDLADALAKAHMDPDLPASAAKLVAFFQSLATNAEQFESSLSGATASAKDLHNPVITDFDALSTAPAAVGDNQSSFAANDLAQRSQSANSYQAQLAAITALGPAQEAAAARKQKEIDLDGQSMSQTFKQQEIDQAGALAYAQAQHSIDQADRSRLLSLQQTIDASRTNLDVVGDSVGKTQALQFAQQNLAAAQAAAAASGTTVSAAERAEIEKLAQVYGDLEQKVALKQLNDDLAFQQSQLGRTTSEQDVASQLRPIFGDDLSSPKAQYEASVIRSTQALNSFKEEAESVADDGLDAMNEKLSEGGSLFDALGAAGASALSELGTAIEKAGIDKLVSGLFDASSSGGSSGGLLGGLLNGVESFFGGGTAHNATGTDYWSGGPTAINEQGGEVLNLPSGTQIIPHDVSMAMAESAGGAPAINFNATTSIIVQGDAGDGALAQMNAALDRLTEQWRQQLPDLIAAYNRHPRRRG